MMFYSYKIESKIYSYLAILMMLSVGCNNNSVADPEFNYDKVADSTKQSSTVTLPGLTSQQNQTTALQLPTNTNSQSGNVALNPEHGKPGHRCEIAVGAPLTSNPVTTSNPIQTTTTTTTTSTPTTIPTTTTAKTTSNNTNSALNPSHGQPGHRCDIGVGQPLNSKPTAITQQTTPQPTPQIQPVVPKTKTTTAPGMNPPHGEPGHRCDIAVGSSLSQPVKKDAPTNTPLILAPPKDSAKK